jgi:integrase
MNINRLTDRECKNARKAMLCDGGGLYLQTTGDAKSWLLRFKLRGASRYLGLGSYPTIGLADARDRADKARRMLADGLDPIEVKRKAKATKATTFAEAAETYIENHGAGWTHRHRVQWERSLKRLVLPKLGKVDVAAIDTADVLKVLNPIWAKTPATANMVRGRIELVLASAAALGLRGDDNPAQWRHRLDRLLPSPDKLAPVEHHPAMDYREIGDFMTELRQVDSVAARALEFVILTAARSVEGTGAQWAEVDMDDKLWTLPASRMKARRQHRVPLSDAAMTVIEGMAAVRCNDAVFPGRGRGSISAQVVWQLLRDMRPGVTIHGFRSTFRDWAGDSGYPREVAEAALAHSIGNQVEQAYRRGDALEQRRKLMSAWADFCGRGTGANVVPLRSGERA